VIAVAHMMAAWILMWRTRRTARPLSGGQGFHALARAIGIRRDVALLEVPRGAMPLTFGVLRPAVFLPADAPEWSEDRRRMVMLHELAHVRRGDLATQMLVRGAVALFWWNPLAWMAWREFVKEREHAADDLVLTAGESAADYAGHLLDIARSMQGAPMLASVAVAMARPSQLEGRLMAILDSRTNRRSSGPRSALAAAMVAAALVAPFAALQAQDKPDPAIQPSVETVVRSAIDLQNYEILDSAAASYITAHKYDAAQQLLDNSLTIRAQKTGTGSPAYAIGLMKLGDLSAKRGKASDAVAFYSKAVALGDTPETAPGLVYLGANALGKKDTLAAENYIDRALAVVPSGPVAGRALTVKGNIAVANELPGLAELQYLQALAQIEPGSGDAAFTMEVYAEFLTKQSRTAEAESMKQQAVAIRQARVAAISAHTTPKSADRAAGDAQASTQTAASSGAPVKVGDGVSAPTLVSKQEPEYSEEARIAKYQGSAVLSVVIGTDGNATGLKLVKSLGFGLDEKAADAILQWKFQPGTKDGAPVPVLATVEVNFRLL
jgi:TonB family protein